MAKYLEKLNGCVIRDAEAQAELEKKANDPGYQGPEGYVLYSKGNGKTGWKKVAENLHTHELVNGHIVNKDVPADAKFTDTVYDDTQLVQTIDAVRSIAENKMSVTGSGKSGQVLTYFDEKTGQWADPSGGDDVPVITPVSVILDTWAFNGSRVEMDAIKQDSIIIVQPADRNSLKVWNDCEIMCEVQGDGYIVFKCITTPEENVAVNILIIDN